MLGISMKPVRARNQIAAFSWLELLVVIVTVMLLAVVFTGVLSRAQPRSKRINCVSHLKQIGLAARMWSNDNGEQFPWAISTNKGGTLEFAASPEVFRHFVVLSNEFSNSKVLVCPTDTAREPATGTWLALRNRNLSYLAGLDANETRPQTILSGDRNILGGVTNGAWLVFRTTNPPSWGADLHHLQGNVCLGDGSVQQFTARSLTNQFQAALATQTNPVIRLAIPRLSVGELSAMSTFPRKLPHLVALVAGIFAVTTVWLVIRRGVRAAAADDKANA